MKPREYLQVDPASLHLPGSRSDGADPVKLQRQFATYGTSIERMPPPEVKRGSDGEFVIYDGVTRATRAAKYCPGRPITVEVTGQLTRPGQWFAAGGRHIMNTTEQTRSELLAALAHLSQLRPQWRLGQMVANLAMTAGPFETGSVWELNDDEALSAAKVLIEQYSAIGCEADQFLN
jgi:hypothetical protein